jgi:exopolyphosphatase/guanosine-5'-triphosphate,3'-diphosphate pyrophosphatase
MWPRVVSHDPLGEAASSIARQAAVIDVGSNSIRLVIYRIEGRAIWTVFNEKALAGLGRDMVNTGRLSPEGIETALAALRRFRAVLDGWEAKDVSIVATAATRDAADGPDFIARVQAETGFQVRVLSGEEEAHFAARGVRAGQPDAQGVVGDLGGSSLELIRLDRSAALSGTTLALGPFALGAPRTLVLDLVRRLVSSRLAVVADQFQTRDFHAVGGAWRNLALLHMTMVDYPLRVTHQYELSGVEAIEAARFVSRQSRNSLERIEGLSRKRFETLPYSALVLEALIEQLGIERIIISAYGVREGLLLETMTPNEQARDPLVEGCEALTAMRGVNPDLGAAVEAWLKPAFDSLPNLFDRRDPVLAAAACRLADLGSRLHPDHRADLAFDQMLRAPIAGMNHAERAFLAMAAFARYTSSSTTPQSGMIARILSPERRQRARALGSAVRLGCDLAGRNPALLSKAHLAISRGKLTLTASPGWSDILLGEQTAKRAQTLAGALKLKLELG